MIHNQSPSRESTIYRTTLPYMPASANRNYSGRKTETLNRKSIKSRNPKQQKRQCVTEMDNYDQRENGRPKGGGGDSSSGNDTEVAEEDEDASSRCLEQGCLG